jgi:hypothetical protein
MSLSFFCCCCTGLQPISTSGRAVCAAECATIGTNCTINGLISAGSCAIAAVMATKQNTQVSAVKSQTLVAQSKLNSSTMLIIVVIAVILFVVMGKK